ncbi:helicase-exonuclease AddAB subunit AddA [Alteribacillus iranensis]|uniref:ATP-dependent helicase/nuclease subunit A n=1 Tax=Alteribacillus iranensis TaxID=930128 RepID=A0A1I1ZW96_9BACI|nr:helicase-exonuclease AddAB subunit AddA [Alteribacillus iranensis]SFE35925.1 DNA helicase/exodeoxyribonuclease V, subunit A [Alteribacillus iranensis]
MTSVKKLPKPEGAMWTDGQWEAISSTGTNFLVSAAAGSGKTAVLVERIIHRITEGDDPLDVDRLLIVTFTNAAAAEMKNRIGEALEREINKRPGSLHVRRQLALLNKAQISTIHAFCMAVIKKYYYKVNIDPQFRLVDDIEGELMREEILEALLEELYSQEGNDDFLLAADCFTNDRNDEGFRKAVLDVHRFSRSHPDPEAWLEKMARAYEINEDTSIEQLTWGQEVMADITERLNAALDLLQEAKETCLSEHGPQAYYETIEADEWELRNILNSTDWETMYETFQSLSFGRLKSIKKSEEVRDDLKERVKELRKAVKEDMNALQSDVFFQPPSDFLKDMQQMRKPVRILIETVKTFSLRYQEKKKELALMDFSDLEHVCLQILSDPQREAASHYQSRFKEVLVDEFQDINHIQETILQFVTQKGQSFFVGDVKQSIYRFRLAEPGIFLNKYKTYNRNDGTPGWRIDLDQNFRSRKEVLDGVNFIFKQLMDEPAGEIQYDENAELKAGNKDYEEISEPALETVFVNKGKKLDTTDETRETEEEDSDTAQLEARYIARRIKDLIDSKHQVYDKHLKQMRLLTYRDIVILMRSMPWANTFLEEFHKEGLPVYADLTEGYFETVEINVMLSLLKTIDNPYQDLPLAAVLRSPITGMNEEELAQLRLMDKYGSFYSALKLAVEEGPVSSWQDKAQTFYQRLCKWREKVRHESLSDFIWDVMQETGYYDFAGGLPGGKQRQANLLALYDRARSYEKTSFRGLFRFLRFIERMQERGDDLGTARALGEQEDVVRLMTIHKSKGLEFPVVFIAGMNKQFNMRDLKQRMIFHKDLGIGVKTIQPDLRVIKDSLPYLAVKNRLYREQIAEEMRALYVAMTRAKEKIILVGTITKPEKTFQNWQRFNKLEETELPVMDRLKAKSFADWLGPSVFRHHSVKEWGNEEGTYGNKEIYFHPAKWAFSFIDSEELQEKQEEEKVLDEGKKLALTQLVPVQEESPYYADVEKQLEWEYPYPSSLTQRSKQTVSEFKRQLPDEYSEPSQRFSFSSSYAERPLFLQKENVSPVEKGTAMHTVLEHIPLEAKYVFEALDDFLEELVQKELLTEPQAQLIEGEDISNFFRTSLGDRLLHAVEVYRELPFSLNRPSENGKDTMFIQGTVDCIFRDRAGNLVLLDYKTDAVKSRFPGNREYGEKMIKSRYQPQIDLYTEAISTIWGEKVHESYIYAFDGGYTINMQK